MKKLAIHILGMHRSGTSMLSGLFNSNGFDIGPDIMRANPDNPRGFKENLAVYRLNERILREHGSCWDDLSTGMAEKAGELIETYRQDVQQVIEEQFALVNQFVIKDPRNSLLFPIWSNALTEMGIEQKVVIILRHPLEVAYSLKQRDDFPLNKGLQLWSNHLLWAERHTRDLPRIFISYSDLLDKPGEHFTQLLQELDVPLGEDQALDTSFADAALKHHQLSYDNISDTLPSPVLQLIDISRNETFDDLDALNHICEQLDTYRNYFISGESQFTSSRQAELSTLKTQIENFRGQAQERQQQLNQKTNEARTLTNQVQQKTQEANQTRQQNQNLQKELEAQREKNQGLENKLAATEKQLSAAKDKAVTLEKALSEAKHTQDTLTRQLASKSQELDDLLKEPQLSDNQDTASLAE